MSNLADDSLVCVNGLSKKFCRSLRKSLWYGLQDLGAEVTARKHRLSGQLREDEFWAVKDISFTLNRGECLGLIGHNGAGKTTLLRMLNGLIRPDAGSISISGRVGALIALGAGFNPLLTGRENILVSGMIFGLSKKQIESQIDEIIEFSGLEKSIDAPVQSYSSGMVVRLGFSIAAKCQPDVLLLDEVLAVGDTDFQAKCLNAVSSFKRNGAGLILVSHNMHHIARYADKVLYLDKGKIHFLGKTDEALLEFTQSPVVSGSDEFAPDWSKVRGAGDAHLTGISLQTTEGVTVSEIAANVPFVMSLAFTLNKPIPRAHLDILVRDRQGILFQGSSKDFGYTFESIESSGRFLIHFDGIPTTSSQLVFYVALLDAADQRVIDWKRDIVVSVRRTSTSIGRIALNLGWGIAAPLPEEDAQP